MMPLSLMARLQAQGVRLALVGDKLKVSAPPGALTAALRSELAEHRDELVAALSQKVAPPPFQLGASSLSSPLSAQQSRLWFLHQADPRSTAYNVSVGLRSRARFDPRAVDLALEALAHRHEILRVRFEANEGSPRQTFDAAPPQCERLDADGAGWAEAALKRAHETPFDLTAGPPWRVQLVGTSDCDTLQFVMHHIITDGASLQSLLPEFAEAYDRILAGGSALGGRPAATGYSAYVAGQKAWLASEAAEDQRCYWRAALDAPPLDLRLPYRRSAGRSGGARVRINLSAQLAGSVRRLAGDAHVTPFVAYLTLFAVLMQRYALQDDLIVGAPMANRGFDGGEHVQGFLANTVPLRLKGLQGLELGEALKAVRDQVLAAQRRQELPYDEIVRLVNPARRRGEDPLCRLMFVLQDRRTEPPTAFERLERSGGDAQTDLTLIVTETPDGAVCEFEFAPSRLEPAMISDLATRFRTLLSAAIRTPAALIAALPLYEAEDLPAALQAYQGAATSVGAMSLAERLAIGMSRSPKRTAIACGAMELTYEALAANVAGFRRELEALGVRPGDRIPVILPRSPESVVALTALSQLGAAFCIIDPFWPQARVQEALAVLGAQVAVVAQGSDVLPADVSPAHVTLDPSAGAVEAPLICANPTGEIYVLFTSGSTGVPKAAVNLQAGVMNRLGVMDVEFGASARHVILQTSHNHFDAAIWQMFWPLTMGGLLVIPTSQRGFDTAEFVHLVGRHGVTHTDIVPSVLDLLVADLDRRPESAEALTSLRFILIGGEAVRAPALRRFTSYAPQVSFINTYGPTEASIGSIFHRIPADAEDPIPIGRPIANTGAMVTDSSGQPAPPGMVGELVLFGRCVGAGYLNDSEATARAFSPLPVLSGFATYRTGDLARLRTDGLLEYLGRHDRQLKIGGVRMNPEEVERVLRAADGVRAAAVTATDDGSGLAAFVVLDIDAAFDAARLREHCRRWLPAAATPREIFAASEIPLTTSGKLDFAALRKLAAKPTPGDRAARAPSGPVAEALERLWRETLGAEAVDLDADFFDLGGASLAALRLTHRVNAAFGVNLSAAMVFEAPTLRAMTELVGACRDAGGRRENEVIRMWEGSDAAPLVLFHAMSGTVHGYRELVANLPKAIPVFGVQHLPRQAALDSMQAMAEHYADLLVARFSDTRRPRLAGWSFGGALAYETSVALERRGWRRLRPVIIDLAAPSGPDPALSQIGGLSDEALQAALDAHGGLGDAGLQRLVRTLQVGAPELRSLTASYRQASRVLSAYTPSTFERALVIRGGWRDGPVDLGWGRHVTDLAIGRVPGSHAGMLEAPGVLDLAQLLAESLEVAAAHA